MARGSWANPCDDVRRALANFPFNRGAIRSTNKTRISRSGAWKMRGPPNPSIEPNTISKFRTFLSKRQKDYQRPTRQKRDTLSKCGLFIHPVFVFVHTPLFYNLAESFLSTISFFHHYLLSSHRQARSCVSYHILFVVERLSHSHQV